jgi:hypothetical protein
MDAAAIVNRDPHYPQKRQALRQAQEDPQPALVLAPFVNHTRSQQTETPLGFPQAEKLKPYLFVVGLNHMIKKIVHFT